MKVPLRGRRFRRAKQKKLKIKRPRWPRCQHHGCRSEFLHNSAGRRALVGSLPERGQVLGVPHGRVQSSCPRHVHIEALSCSGSDLNPQVESRRSESEQKTNRFNSDAESGGIAHLSRRPAAGEEVAVVVAMQRDVEHAGVIVEDFLGAVAVVDVLPGGSRRGR